MSENKARKFYILWTYIANHSENYTEVMAATPEEAIGKFLGSYGPDFRTKCKVYAFTGKPSVYDGRKAAELAKELREKADAAERMLGY